MSAINRLYVCQTCMRDAPLSEAEPTRGQRLGDRVAELLGDLQSGSPINLIRAPCLSGCLSPCNVALRCSGKYSLRFSRLGPDDAESVVAFASAYAESSTGEISEADWPERLRGNRTVNTPPPNILLRKSSQEI